MNIESRIEKLENLIKSNEVTDWSDVTIAEVDRFLYLVVKKDRNEEEEIEYQDISSRIPTGDMTVEEADKIIAEYLRKKE